jgi:hypothetical protein
METKTSAKDRFVRLSILIIGSLIVLAIAYGSGMRSKSKRIHDIDEQRKVAERDYRTAQRDLRLRLAVSQQLEARRQVSLGLLELDKRNFGTAQERLQKASTLLKTAQTTEATIPNLLDIATKLAELNLVATPDTGAQRTALLEMAEAIDRELENSVPSFLENAAKADAASPVRKPTLVDIPVLPPAGNDVTRVK